MALSSSSIDTISVIITSYNEVNTITEVLDRVLSVPIGLEKEIIVVDGNSTDGTRDVLEKYRRKSDKVHLIFEEKREGKGAALRKGFKIAKGDIILIQDADLEVTPDEYPKLISPIVKREADVVYGSRFKKGRGLAPIGSYIGNQIVTWLINILFFKKLSDVATCYKVFRRSVLDGLNLCCNGFDFDAEFTCRLIKKRKRIFEIPILYNPRGREEGKKLNWTAGFTSIWIILKLRFLLK